MGKLILGLILFSSISFGAYLDSVEVSNFPAIQPVSQSGVWTIDSITSPLTISGTVNVLGPLTDAQLRASAVPVSLASVPTHPVTQSGAWTVGVNNFPTVQPVNDNGGSLTVDGSVGITGSVAVTGPLTDTQLRATPVPVSGTVSTGGLTDAQLRASDVPVSLTSTTISNFPATQAISAASLPLPAGASTETTAAAINTKTPALGQALMAASTPVVIASNQTALPVTGTFFQATQPVSIASSVAVTGPLTDTQLRATPVPVSGTVSTGGLTDTQLRAAAVPVSLASVPTHPVTQSGAFNVGINAGTNAIGSITNTGFNVTGTLPAYAATPTFNVGTIAGIATETTTAALNAKVPTGLTVTSGRLQVELPAGGGGLTDTQLRATPVPVSISGGSTLAEQQLQTTALQLIDNSIGPVAAGTSATNSQLTGGVFNTTLPTLATGQQVATQLDAKGRPLRATTNGRFSYVASTPIAGLAVGATASQDIFRISGSATKAVYIKKIRVSVTATAAQGNNIHLIKRSAANTGGTSTALVLVPSDSNYAASTSSVLQYTVAPTSGAAVGPVRSAKYLIPTATGLYNSEMIFEFGENDGEPLVLRGVAQGLGIVFGTAPGAGANANITVVWEEE